MKPPASELGELAKLFVRLGFTAFGGPAAHIAMMQDEVVTRREWLTDGEFLDLLGATNLIPGPNSTEMAIHIGRRRAGLRGLAVAGVCFIAPAALITSSLAWIYVRFGTLPRALGILYGVKPVIIAVIAQAVWALGRTALGSRLLVLALAACLAARFCGVHELIILLGAGLVVAAARGHRAVPSGSALRAFAVGSLGLVGGTAASPGPLPFSYLQLTQVFLTIGSTLFGSGYVLLAYLRADLVERLAWIGERQLLDAVAVGQLTPGPVLSTATFVGYIVGGGWGALVATVAIFAPSFFFVAVSARLVPRVRRSRVARAFLDGVNVASLALMAAVTWDLGRAALVDPTAFLLAAASAVLLFRFRVNSAWLVVGGGAVGLALSI